MSSTTDSKASTAHTSTASSRSKVVYRGRHNQSITLLTFPAEVQCFSCSVPKSERAFSFAEKERYKESRGEYKIICITCKGVPKQELECDGCGKTLPITRFAFSQRRAESPQCYECVAETVNEPVQDRDVEQRAFAKTLTQSKWKEEIQLVRTEVDTSGQEQWKAREQGINVGEEEWDEQWDSSDSDVCVEDSDDYKSDYSF